MNFNIITLIILGLIAYIISLLKMFVVKLDRGQAIIRTGTGGTRISFEKLFVLPSLHKIEIVDVSMKKLTINCTLKDKDLEDVPLTIFLLVKLDTSSTETFINTVNTFTAPVVSDGNFILEYFNGKAIEAVQKAVGSFPKEKILHCDSKVKEGAIQNLLPNISGYVIEDLIITTNQKFNEAQPQRTHDNLIQNHDQGVSGKDFGMNISETVDYLANILLTEMIDENIEPIIKEITLRIGTMTQYKNGSGLCDWEDYVLSIDDIDERKLSITNRKYYDLAFEVFEFGRYNLYCAFQASKTRKYYLKMVSLFSQNGISIKSNVTEYDLNQW